MITIYSHGVQLTQKGVLDMDDISRNLESIYKIKSAISPSAIKAIQKQSSTIQNAMNASAPACRSFYIIPVKCIPYLML